MYAILIVTSGNLLKWPNRRFDPPFTYDTVKEAKQGIMKYIKWSYSFNKDKRYKDGRKYQKRLVEEFEIVEIKDENTSHTYRNAG